MCASESSVQDFVIILPSSLQPLHMQTAGRQLVYKKGLRHSSCSLDMSDANSQLVVTCDVSDPVVRFDLVFRRISLQMWREWKENVRN